MEDETMLALRSWLWCIGLVGLAALARGSLAGDDLVVHEWGTFTSLVDEQGRELAGINVDDEPVPEFVHNLSPFLLSAPVVSSEHWLYRSKGAPRHHPQVTMRLETPVIYFYPPAGRREPLQVDVSVRFRGGWLTEFYPQAHADTPGLTKGRFEFGALTPQTTSSLAWNDLAVGTDGTGPETDESVWLAPAKSRRPTSHRSRVKASDISSIAASDNCTLRCGPRSTAKLARFRSTPTSAKC